MARIGSGDVLIRWDTGDEVQIGTIELSGGKLDLGVKVDVPVWRVGLAMVKIGVGLMMPRRRGTERDAE